MMMKRFTRSASYDSFLFHYQERLRIRRKRTLYLEGGHGQDADIHSDRDGKYSQEKPRIHSTKRLSESRFLGAAL